jgi:hypothetical protein
MDEVLERRDMIQIVTERLSPATLLEIEEIVRDREGKPLEIGVPRDRLEALFLRIVQEANARQLETAGSVAAGEIAGFLGEPQETQAVLESLVKVEREPALPLEPVPPPPSPREEVLSNLTAPSDEQKQEEERRRKPRPSQVDRDVLEDLVGGGEPKDRP